MHPYYKSKLAKETNYCQELTQLQFQCERFDTFYHSTKNKKLRKKQIDEIKKILIKTDDTLKTTCTTKMRDAFIHHVIKYMRFEIKILGQKLTQFDADTEMQNVLLLRQKFYRQNMSILNLMQVQKLDYVDLTLPVPAETERNLSWLLQETLKCQPRHEGHALQWLQDKISGFYSFNIFAVRASLVVSIKNFTSLGLFVQEKYLRSRREPFAWTETPKVQKCPTSLRLFVEKKYPRSRRKPFAWTETPKVKKNVRIYAHNWRKYMKYKTECMISSFAHFCYEQRTFCLDRNTESQKKCSNICT